MRVIGGSWGGRRIEAPAGRTARPTLDRIREAWMSIIAGELPDARVLDLFAGSGALGIEALSRGARHTTFVENNAAIIRVLERNLATLAVPRDRFRLVRGDALRFLSESANAEERAFDLVLADPPYDQGLARRVVELFRARPVASLLCIEHSRTEEIPDGADLHQRRYADTILSFLTADDEG